RAVSQAPDDDSRARALLEQYIEGHLESGVGPDPAALCGGDAGLAERLRRLVAAYHALDQALSAPPEGGDPGAAPAPLPSFEGFRTVERLGRGGGGEVLKLEDLTLGRAVAAKVLRRDSPLAAGLPDFLREARSLALFDDPRIVRLLEFRPGEPPVLLMEYVDGFTLAEVGPALDPVQQARLLAEVAEAVDHAHGLGLQHRDLKPANILVTAALKPKILDFGLSRGDPHAGHGRGTLAYMAPEQLDPQRPIDARADVYALGVVLYELLCRTRPYQGADEAALLAAIREGRPRLPIEIAPQAPEPLQAVALKAMSADPADRYPSARELALDLRRFADGHVVHARPRLYQAALERRVEPHLHQVAEWERLHLIYPHEGERLRDAYRRLEAREDDWIVQSRLLSFPQIALYFGAFLLLCASVLAFLVYLEGAVKGVAWPLLALGLPCASLHLTARALQRGRYRAAAVAYDLGAAVLVPPLLLILFRELGWWLAPAGAAGELFAQVSNRQLQVAALVSCAWAGWLALRTHTVALSSGCTLLLAGAYLSLLAEAGLKTWLDEGRWDRLSLHLVPLVALLLVLGRWLEERQRPWFAQPLYAAAAALYVLALELLALNGRALSHLGVTLTPAGGAAASDPTLLDTVAAMTVNGALILGAGSLLERRGTALMRPAVSFLYVLSPFTLLEPLAYLNGTGEYSRRFDWLYLLLALVVAFASRFKQRRSFFYAGLTNTAGALWLITDHYHWLGRRAWPVAVVAAGLASLALGFLLHRQQQAAARR
ncbi:MAG TPA: serine/threonine-protein kinase, partial [Vicinamibacteria bacterium]